MAGLNLLTPSGGYVNLSPTNTATNVSLNLPAANGSLISANTGSGAFTTSNFNSASTFGFRNRIINGDMRIDQRNAGVEVSGNDLWPLDRFNVSSASGVVFKGQRVTDAPSGFSNSIKLTQSTQGGVTYKCLQQYIEGFNIADFGFGTASANPFTISFWVKASITGNYSIVFQNAASGASRWSYATTYTVSAANTWEFKTIVVPGNTSGTWYTDNQRGLGVIFDIGSTGYETTTTNSWSNENALRITGTVNLSANAGATLQITGVQLEKGSVATPFDFRSYGQELALCQRYYWQEPTNSYSLAAYSGGNSSALAYRVQMNYVVPMRATPSVTTPTYAASTGTITAFGFNPRDTSSGEWFVHTSAAGFFSIYTTSTFALSAEL